MRIMIFGGLGFIGSHVVELLHQNPSNQLFVFDDESTGKINNIRHLISEKHNTRTRFELLDIRKRGHVDDAICRFKPEAIVLLAAQAAISKSELEPQFDADVNIGGMLNVIASAKKCGVGRIVFSSTSAVYREKRWGKLRETDFCEPKSPYGISKLAAEHYLRTRFQPSVILRFGNVYGPRQVPIGDNQVIPRMIRHFQFGDPFQIFGNGNQTRDYIYVEDVADAVCMAALVGTPGTYNIASGRRLSVNQVGDAMSEAFGLPARYPWVYREEGDPRQDICLDVRKAYEYLGWKPRISFREGLKRTVEWWEKAPPDNPQPAKMPIAYEVVR